MIARAATDYHRAGRLALGMSDGATATGPISFNAIQMGVQFGPVEPHNLEEP
jgi:hypothetical protein